MIEVKQDEFKNFLQTISKETGYEFEYEKTIPVQSDPGPARGENHHLAIKWETPSGTNTKNIHEPDFSRLLSELVVYLTTYSEADEREHASN